MPQPHIDNSSFYDAMWAEWNDMILYSPAPRFRRTRILQWLRSVPFTNLLDVGCGNGEFLLQAHKEFPGVRLAGADVSPEVIRGNREKLPDVDFHVLDLNRENIGTRFDVVTCMEVVEHCTDYREAIARLAAMTGKRLFVTVPCGPLFEIDRRVGHTRHFTADEIGTAIRDAGLKLVRLQEWGFPFFNLYKHAININPDKMCSSFLSSKKYTAGQKMLAAATYAAFKFSMPLFGYQLFAEAARE